MGTPTQFPQKKGHSPTHFLSHVYCGQTAGWMKMPLGMEVNLSPGDVVLDGVAAPHKRGTAPVFGLCLLLPNCWVDENATCYGSRPLPKPHCVRPGPSSPRERGTDPLFSAHVYCGDGSPSQLLLSSSTNGCPKPRQTINNSRQANSQTNK